MDYKQSLADTFRQATYPLSGHGPRIVQVLQEALQHVDGERASDQYGTGAIIEDFQTKMAQFLGKQAAVFFPSGTMAQQIALRIWCDQKQLKRVAYHPLCHLEIHEQNGLHMLHHIDAVLLGQEDRLIKVEDLLAIEDEISCLLLELPQREIGGQLPSYESLEKICSYCRERGIKLHLDGARLLEVLPYYEKTAAEICALFDSVYLSFYKGIGGVAGAILAGDAAFIEESVIWKRRHGGDLISLYPYVLSADFYFEQRKDKMGHYYEGAKELAGLFNNCSRVYTKPHIPVSNMFHVHFDLPANKVAPILTEVCQITGVGFSPSLKERGQDACSFELSVGDRYALIPHEVVAQAMTLMDEKLTAAE